ncbi:MAG: adenylate/guanylate cyclase domain-containing protein [Solirubrobacteraceae bacterium]|nr:adenylate/guanylate cyclase domain-containing protein [Solirubrobacteraceae bacterium]
MPSHDAPSTDVPDDDASAAARRSATPPERAADPGAPDGPPTDADRERLVARLADAGWSADALRDAAARGRLVLLATETRLRDERTLTTAELAARCDVDAELLEQALLASGLMPGDPSAREWGPADEPIARLVGGLDRVGLSRDSIVDLARVLGENGARIGAASITGLAAGVSREGDTELTLADRIDATLDPVDAHLGDALGAIVRRSAVSQLSGVELAEDQVADGRLTGAWPMTIGFADVVGFTRLGERDGAERLDDVATALAAYAGASLTGAVRLVKTIGDAVMLAGPRPDEVVATLLALLRRSAADDDLPPLRAGAATGSAVPRGGDWFGPAVNRASRVCGAARPDSLLVDDATRRALPEASVASRSIGRVRLKGVGAVPLHRVRSPDERRGR